MKIKILVFLLILVLFQVVNNFIVLQQDKCVPIYDRAEHVLQSHRIYNDYKDRVPLHDTAQYAIKRGFPRFYDGPKNAVHRGSPIYSYFYHIGDRYYPPLFYLTSAALFSFIDFSVDFAAYANIIFIFILIFSIYGIGRRLYDSRTGLLAAFIVSMFPGIFAFSRVTFLDFPLTAMVTLSIFLLLLTEGFKKRGYCLLLGLTMGLGMLTKWSFFVYISAPIAYYLFISFKQVQGDYKRRLLNLFFVLSVVLLVSLPWYLPNISTIIQRLSIISMWRGSFSSNSSLLSYMTYYIGTLYLYQLYPFLFLLFIISLFRHIIKRRNWLVILWLVIPFLAFTALPNKDPRYTMPILPAMGIIMASEIISFKKLTLALLSLFLILQFFLLSYVPQSVFNAVELKTYPLRVNLNYAHYKEADPLFETGLLFPDRKGSIWGKKAYEMTKIFKKYVVKDKPGGWLALFVFNIGEIFYSVQFAFNQQNLPIVAECPAIEDISLQQDFDHNQVILDYDFVVTKSGYQGVNSLIAEDVIGNLTRAFGENRDRFILIGTLQDQDHSQIYIYSTLYPFKYLLPHK